MAFEELMSDSSIGNSFSKDNAIMWGRQIANAYLEELASGQQGSSMNEKVASVAQTHALNSDQIQRVVEAANLAVDRRKSGKDFQVARLENVLPLLKNLVQNRPETITECKENLDDYLMPPSRPVAQVADLENLFGEGIPPQTQSTKKILIIKIAKAEHAKKALEDYEMNLMMKKAEAEKELVKTAKRAVLDNHEDINDICQMAVNQGFTKEAAAYFPIINHVLVSQFVIEKTAFVAPPELISKDLAKNGLPAIDIENGNHGVIKSFQTLRKIDDDILTARKAIVLAESKIKKLNEEAKRVS